MPDRCKFKQLALWFITACIIGACGSSPAPIINEQPTESTAGSIDELIELANTLSGRAGIEARLDAIDLLLQDERLGSAQQQFTLLGEMDGASPEMNLRIALLGAKLGTATGNLEAALSSLLSLPLTQRADADYALALGQTYLLLERPTDAFASLSNSSDATNPNNTNIQSALWSALSLMSTSELDALATAADNYETRGWVELARTTNAQQSYIRRELDAIAQWRRIWSSHSAATSLPQALMHLENVWEARPRQIALLLPLQEPAGIAIQEGFLSAYFDALETSREVPKISFYDSSSLTNIYPLYDSAVAEGADLIIGPLDKELVNQLYRLPELPVPTLALNYADNVEAINHDQFFQFGLAPEDEIRQAVALAAQHGYINAAVITPTGQNYSRLSTEFENAWSEIGGELVSRTTFDSASDYAEVIKRLMAIDSSERRADSIEDLLPREAIEFTPRRRQDIDFIYLIANPRQGRQIKPTLAFYFAESLPVLAYPSIYDGARIPDNNRDLDGIIILDAPWLLDSDDELKLKVTANLRQAAGPLERLRAMGIDSFRLHTRLGQLSNAELPNLEGVTGVLTMNSLQKIERQLKAAAFYEGIPQEYKHDSNQ